MLVFYKERKLIFDKNNMNKATRFVSGLLENVQCRCCTNACIPHLYFPYFIMFFKTSSRCLGNQETVFT